MKRTSVGSEVVPLDLANGCEHPPKQEKNRFQIPPTPPCLESLNSPTYRPFMPIPYMYHPRSGPTGGFGPARGPRRPLLVMAFGVAARRQELLHEGGVRLAGDVEEDRGAVLRGGSTTAKRGGVKRLGWAHRWRSGGLIALPVWVPCPGL